VLAGHTGDDDTARAHLDDPDPSVRASAIAALDRCGALDGNVLERACHDGSSTVRRRAVEVAARRPGDQPPSLLPALADPDPTVVEAAVWACGERQPTEPGAVALLADLAASHPEALCREAAAAALGAIGDPAGLPAILRACTDRATVRRRAVLALAPFEGPEVEAALRHALTDRDWQVRQAAEDLLEPPL
jgi:HEAT repeat protein